MLRTQPHVGQVAILARDLEQVIRGVFAEERQYAEPRPRILRAGRPSRRYLGCGRQPFYCCMIPMRNDTPRCPGPLRRSSGGRTLRRNGPVRIQPAAVAAGKKPNILIYRRRAGRLLETASRATTSQNPGDPN